MRRLAIVLVCLLALITFINAYTTVPGEADFELGDSNSFTIV